MLHYVKMWTEMDAKKIPEAWEESEQEMKR